MYALEAVALVVLSISLTTIYAKPPPGVTVPQYNISCRGDIKFQEFSIPEGNPGKLIRNWESHSANVCAELCYFQKGCKSAIFDPKPSGKGGECNLYSGNGNCSPDTPSVKRSQQKGRLELRCIFCEENGMKKQG